MQKHLLYPWGSLIVPDKIDADFLNMFKILMKIFKKGFRFVIICGGGKLARNLQTAASKVTKLSNKELDLLNSCNKIKCILIKAHFWKNAHDTVIFNPNDRIKTKKHNNRIRLASRMEHRL